MDEGSTIEKVLQDKEAATAQPRPAAAVPFPEELEHLEHVLHRLDQALADADDSVQRLDREYGEFKRYMAEYRSEVDAHEKLQDEALLSQTDRAGAFAVELRARAAKLKDSPYFARIDFAPRGGRVHSCYIGRFGFNCGRERLVFDWRAPISGLFYECSAGPAGYDAPSGRIEGTLSCKRQFKIAGGVMEYAIESDDSVQDELLQRELAHSSTDRMRSIISSIQREQNAVIRNDSAPTLLIQGAAGSGKTSIALHRIAFLLYRFKGQLTARDVALLSPNKVFADYISNVIPELGEEPVVQLDIVQIATRALGGAIGFEPPCNPLEEADEARLERSRFKASAGFLRQLEAYLQQLPVHPRSAKTALDCYEAFFRSIGRKEMLLSPSRSALEWDDVFPFILVLGACGMLQRDPSVRQLVVDEMQDYTPVQHAALSLIFPASRKTLLGDFGQALNPCHSHGLEDITALYPDAQVITLSKSYRSSFEIMSLARRICPWLQLELVERHGAQPRIVRCADAEGRLAQLAALASAFEEGSGSLGIIAKTEAEARQIHAALPARCQAQLIEAGSTSYSGGVSVCSVSMAKGLEFDEVIVANAGADAFGSEHDRKLLYVACTRAMHRLTLLYAGSPSPFLAEDAGSWLSAPVLP